MSSHYTKGYYSQWWISIVVLSILAFILTVYVVSYKPEARILETYTSMNNVWVVRWIDRDGYHEATVFDQKEEVILKDWLAMKYNLK